MGDTFYLKPGDQVVLERHVTEAAVNAFADVSGDHSPNHVGAEVMAQSTYGGRIAHGALLVAYMSACSTEIIERVPGVRATETPVSLGYDRIRFIRPVYIGDQLSLLYKVREVDAKARRTRADISITKQDGSLVCVAEHILKWVA